jgi:hypothetical protein
MLPKAIWDWQAEPSNPQPPPTANTFPSPKGVRGKEEKIRIPFANKRPRLQSFQKIDPKLFGPFLAHFPMHSPKLKFQMLLALSTTSKK